MKIERPRVIKIEGQRLIALVVVGHKDLEAVMSRNREGRRGNRRTKRLKIEETRAIRVTKRHKDRGTKTPIDRGALRLREREAEGIKAK